MTNLAKTVTVLAIVVTPLLARDAKADHYLYFYVVPVPGYAAGLGAAIPTGIALVMGEPQHPGLAALSILGGGVSAAAGLLLVTADGPSEAGAEPGDYRGRLLATGIPLLALGALEIGHGIYSLAAYDSDRGEKREAYEGGARARIRLAPYPGGAALTVTW
ncbi:MAG: hypothetical protein V3S30_10065 [Thermoanaerobaculia bacterium]